MTTLVEAMEAPNSIRVPLLWILGLPTALPTGCSKHGYDAIDSRAEVLRFNGGFEIMRWQENGTDRYRVADMTTDNLLEAMAYLAECIVKQTRIVTFEGRRHGQGIRDRESEAGGPQAPPPQL